MNALNSICATKVTSVITVKYDRGVTRAMTSRAWYGLSLAIDGEIVYYHNGREIVSDSNHLVVLPMGADYHFVCTKPGRFTLINFLSTDSFQSKDFLRIPVEAPETFLKYHKSLERLYNFNNPDNFAEFMAVFYKMLAVVCNSEGGVRPSGKTALPALKPAMDFLEENILNPELTNSLIAEKGCISEVYFTKLFRQSFGISPKQYIQQARINRSKEMLIAENSSVSDIAEICGYASLYHFCRVFKQKTGYTPGEYRNEFRNIDM